MPFLMLFSRAVGLLSLAGLLGTCPVFRPGPARPRALFPIVAAGRWGFIDSAGTVIIAPRFDQVQPFSEGRAAVRTAGYYSYIDNAGHVAVPLAGAYASPFRQGYAVVMNAGQRQLIDQAGQRLALPAAYKDLHWQPSPGRAGVTLATNEQQVLSLQGHLLNKATFSAVGELGDNRLVVQQKSWRKTRTGIVEQPEAGTGVLDGQGKWVIPYHRFSYISPFREGLALAARFQAASCPRLPALSTPLAGWWCSFPLTRILTAPTATLFPMGRRLCS